MQSLPLLLVWLFTLAATAARAEELANSGGWQVFPSGLATGASPDPATETQWYKLVPPNGGQSVIVGASLVKAIESGSRNVDDVYSFARGKNEEFLQTWKNDFGTGQGLTSPTATVEVAIPEEPKKDKDTEFLWDLGRKKPEATPLTGAPPPPKAKWRVSGMANMWSFKQKHLPKYGCQRVKPGESTLIEFDEKVESPTDIGAVYRLRRETDKLWLLEVNVKYEPDDDFDMPIKKADVDAHYRRIANECYAKYAPSFRNPDTDQYLKILLTKDPEVPQQVIKIGSAYIRASVKHYSSDVQCPVILHETFHLFGLVDEYDEERPLLQAVVEAEFEEENSGEKEKIRVPFRAHYDCRAIAPVASLMHWHEEAAENSKSTKVKVERCFCDKGTSCKALVKQFDGKSCPKGSRVWTQLRELLQGAAFKPAPDDDESFLLKTNYEDIVKGDPSRQALLHPAHFRAVTEPGCDDVNWKFYACARNAYRFSRDFPEEWKGWGAKRLDYQGCLPAPADCRHGYDWLK